MGRAANARVLGETTAAPRLRIRTFSGRLVAGREGLNSPVHRCCAEITMAQRRRMRPLGREARPGTPNSDLGTVTRIESPFSMERTLLPSLGWLLIMAHFTL